MRSNSSIIIVICNKAKITEVMLLITYYIKSYNSFMIDNKPGILKRLIRRICMKKIMLTRQNKKSQ